MACSCGLSLPNQICNAFTVQNIILRTINGASWYTMNTEIHKYLETPTVEEIDRPG